MPESHYVEEFLDIIGGEE